MAAADTGGIYDVSRVCDWALFVSPFWWLEIALRREAVGLGSVRPLDGCVLGSGTHPFSAPLYVRRLVSCCAGSLLLVYLLVACRLATHSYSKPLPQPSPGPQRDRGLCGHVHPAHDATGGGGEAREAGGPGLHNRSLVPGQAHKVCALCGGALIAGCKPLVCLESWKRLGQRVYPSVCVAAFR
jgi:hypothetical protein